MSAYISKLKLIVPVFLAISFGTMLSLVLLRWVFSIQFSIITIKEDVWGIWIPLALPWVPILIWLRPRLRSLIFKDADKARMGYYMITWLTACAMSCISQSYLTTATGKLFIGSSIKQMHESEETRYCRLEKFIVAKNYGGEYAEFSVSGKHNQYFDMELYFAFPIIDDSSDIFLNIPKYWYGINYSEQISNNLSDDEKENKYQFFYKDCAAKLENYNFNSLDHFERTPLSDKKESFIEAIKRRVKTTANTDFVILEPIQEKYELRNGNKFAWIFYSLGIGLGILLFILIWPGYSETNYKKFLQGKKPKQDDLKDMLNYLIPKEGHFSTSIILDLNIIVFLIMIFSGVHLVSPKALDLLAWGANRRLETANGEWWRLFTSMFLHAGILHIFLNASGLVISALFIEPLLGRKKFFILYILSGLSGSIASICWYPNTISVGASGAIFGIFGGILGLLLTDAFPKQDKKWVLSFIGIYAGVSLLWGLTGGIDNAAHIGGLVSGALIAIILYKFDKKNSSH